MSPNKAPELTGFARFYTDMARESLAELSALDMGDDLAMARMLGRLKVVLPGLLQVVDPEGDAR